MLFRYSTLPISLLVAASLLTGCSPANETSSVVAPADAGATTPVADVADGTDRVAQLSLTDGTVSLRPSDDQEWATAEINQPVLEGTELFADEGSTGEVVLGDNRYVRFANGADVEFTQLDADQVQLDVTDGTVTLALDELEASERYEVNTPGGAIVPTTGGEFRIDIDENGETWLTVRRGTARVSTPNGTFDINEGDRVNLSADDPSSVEVARYDNDGSPDDWDNFNDQRRVYYTSQAAYEHPEPVRSLYGRSDIFGIAALAAAGIWQLADHDRYVWYPRVSNDWSPYENGSWDYSPRVGYTWISNDSWGWAPYHYGRWDHDGTRWGWSPSDGIATTGYSSYSTRYTWRPALVYTYQPPQSNSVMWVPLAYGEPYVAYTQPWRGNVNQQQVAFVPRFYREQRGIVYVSNDGFNRRERARKADRQLLKRYEKFDVANAPVYRIPKPDRIVAVDRVARVRPSDKVRNRAVVVSTDVADAKRVNRRAARADRPVVKADGKKLEARRPAAGVARQKPAPRITRQGGKMKADRSGPRARAVAPTAPFDSARPAPVERAPAQPKAGPKGGGGGGGMKSGPKGGGGGNKSGPKGGGGGGGNKSGPKQPKSKPNRP